MYGIVALQFFSELFADFNLVLKIFVLLSIVSFVRNHLGTGPLAIALILGFGWFIFFNAWLFFGGIYLLYTLLAFGISGILIDFFFVSGFGGGGQEMSEVEKHARSPMSSGADVARRQARTRMGGRGPGG